MFLRRLAADVRLHAIASLRLAAALIASSPAPSGVARNRTTCSPNTAPMHANVKCGLLNSYEWAILSQSVP